MENLASDFFKVLEMGLTVSRSKRLDAINRLNNIIKSLFVQHAFQKDLLDILNVFLTALPRFYENPNNSFSQNVSKIHFELYGFFINYLRNFFQHNFDNIDPDLLIDIEITHNVSDF